MNLPAGSFILERGFFHQVSMLAKALRPLSSQRLLGAEGSCLGLRSADPGGHFGLISAAGQAAD